MYEINFEVYEKCENDVDMLEYVIIIIIVVVIGSLQMCT